MTFRSLAVLAACLFAFACATTSFAQSPPPDATGDDAEPPTTEDDPSLQSLDAIVVSGRQPGPGLWKVMRGDHTLWILGTLTPLPKRMEWDASTVERRLSESQELLLLPRMTMDADVGFFKGLMLLPSMLKARRNPDGKTLRELVPAEQYTRWLALKQRYIGGDQGIEEWRPLFAALELYEKAIARSGLRQDSLVVDTVVKAARRNGLKSIDPKIVIKVEDPKTLLKEFQRETLDDTLCFERTLARIESDLGVMAQRANAWAQGDIETLRELQSRNTQWSACNAAMTGNAVARKIGMVDIEQRVQRRWMEAAEAALSRNKTTFALLPVSQLLAPEGYLSQLAAKGYVIEEP